MFEHETCRSQGVHVPTQRTMDEPHTNPGFDLFDVDGLRQVVTDTPVLLGWVENLVVDPTAVGRLEQRMVQEKEKGSS